jgi:hypothetical protein
VKTQNVHPTDLRLISGYIQGRIFLAGDAAHTVPPTGGFGGNCGIHDAHNLAWKLALVLNKKAGEKLLETYEQERLPIGTFTVDQAYARYINRSAPELRDDRVHKEVTDFQFELGQRYHESEGVEVGVTGGGKIWEDPSEPTATAGSRAPHFWMDHTQQVSVHDVLSRDTFTLLVPRSHHKSFWMEAGNSLEGEFPLKVANISHPYFCSLYKITHSGCVLVRPDAYIAWKAAGITGEAGRETEVCREKLKRVLQKVLFLDARVSVPQRAIVNGIKEIKINGNNPMTNGTTEVSGDQLLSYLKGSPSHPYD